MFVDDERDICNCGSFSMSFFFSCVDLREMGFYVY